MKLIALLLLSMYICITNATVYIPTTTTECGAQYASPIVQMIPNDTVNQAAPLFWNSNDTALGFGVEYYWFYDTGIVVYLQMKEIDQKDVNVFVPLIAPKYQSVIGYGLNLYNLNIKEDVSAYTISTPLVSFSAFDTLLHYISCGHADNNGLLLIGLTTNSLSIIPNGRIYSITGNNKKLLTSFNNNVNDFAWNYNYTRLYGVGDHNVCVLQYYANNGTLGSRIFEYTETKYPFSTITGIEVDSNGTVWLALKGAGLIMSLNIEQKKVLFVYPVQPTSLKFLTFGGPNLDQLFVGSRNLQDSRSGCAYIITGLGAQGNADNFCNNTKLVV